MARLRCAFSLLRRSYRRDAAGRDPAVEIPRVRRAVKEAFARDAAAVGRDHDDLVSAIESLVPAPESQA